ncbi:MULTISPECIES: hypothetical protein [unclassified Bradyrhizobium]|uniref:hypothetical protein n=1 Tax=unclassified Bradyrhizobium TaxID=2631580 RepID=UPI00291610D0|nr:MULTISPECIES: hypothetical protein [unclassified Bradyrhizobium]
MSSLDTNLFPNSLICDVGDEAASLICRQIVDVFHANGINTYQIGADHKPTMIEVGAAILKSAALRFEQLMK